MYNDLFSIGPFTVHGYGLMITIGVLAALFIAEARAKKRDINADVLYPLTLVCVGFGFAGAKVLFCIVEWRQFFKNPWQLLTGNGFVVYGGIIGGVLADIVLPSVAVAQGFGRIGYFLAGCCYGRETNSFFGIAFTHSDYAPNGVKLLPTQLFSAAGMFLIAGFLFWYAKKERKKGQVGALYLILYSIGRFIIEFFRDDYRGAVGFLSTSQFISLFILATGVLLFRKRSVEKE